MIYIFKKKHFTAQILSLALIFNLITVEQGFAKPELPEVPTAESGGNGEDFEEFLQYSDEDLIEITDQGIFDAEGNEINIDEEEARAAYEALPEETKKFSAFEEYKASIISNWGGKKEFSERRLDGIRDNLDAEIETFNSFDAQIKEAEEALEPIREEIKSLEGQIEVLNSQLNVNKEKINKIEHLVAEKQVLIKDLMRTIERSKVELKVQEKVVLDYITLLYEEEQEYLGLYDTGANTVKLLLSDNSLSETLMGKDYLAIMEQTGREVFHALDERQMELEEKQETVFLEQKKLQGLYASLNQEKDFLKEGRISKKQLLEDTKGEEAKYQALLEESLRQQEESALAIANMQDNIEFIEEKLKLLDESLEDLDALEEEATEFDYSEDNLIEIKDEEEAAEPTRTAFLDWPVEPKAVTAYFHDPTYPKQWGPHNAIDLRAPMRTPIYAPANAYVFQTKDNGMGYSYIILAHKNNIMTVYGHVYDILVKPGTVVKRGDLIGLTGGAPGTKGAGWQTTGPHLHFEVYRNGEHVNPLEYLDLAQLPIEYIPDDYLYRIGGN